jgi:probable F420-dependent oxidoreductase
VIPNPNVERFGETFYEPLTVLSYAAGITEKIKLGTSSIILSHRNPIVVAKIISTLDVLSGGRLIITVSAGWLEDEFKALGIPFSERGNRSDEYIKIFKELWTEERPTFQGEYFRFSNIKFEPKPIQKPYPPIWVGGNSRRGIRRADELGNGWHPTRPTLDEMLEGVKYLRELALEKGRDPDEIEISVRQPLRILGADDTDVRRRPFIGTTPEIIQGIKSLIEAGVSHFMLDLFYGVPELHAENLERMLITIERFTNEIKSKL